MCGYGTQMKAPGEGAVHQIRARVQPVQMVKPCPCSSRTRQQCVQLWLYFVWAGLVVTLCMAVYVMLMQAFWPP